MFKGSRIKVYRRAHLLETRDQKIKRHVCGGDLKPGFKLVDIKNSRDGERRRNQTWPPAVLLI